MSYRLACSGTVSPSGLAGPLIEHSLAMIEQAHGRPSLLVSGAAYGIDTIWIQLAMNRWPKAAVLLIAPDAPHNEHLFKLCRGLALARSNPSVNIVRLVQMPKASSNPSAYMQRNDQVQHNADVLSAHPAQPKEVMRSGTWATIRRFRKHNKPVWLSPVQPNILARWM